MKIKALVILLPAILLTAGIAAAQDTTPEVLGGSADNVFQLFTDGGYLGVYAEDITRENMGRYNLSQPRGVGVTQVIKDSPAEKAGLRKGDVILRIDGENVTSVRKLNRLVSEISPDQVARVSYSRAGAEQEVSATIAKRNLSNNFHGFMTENPKVWKWEGPVGDQGDMVFALGSGRRIGINTTPLTKQLADYFGVAGGKGVLVTSVSDDSPASKAGLRAGDVITSIDGEEVDSTGDITRIINKKKDGDVSMTVIRNKSQQTIRVTPKEGGGLPRGVITRPQVGRTIFIPRVEFPSFPEISVTIPSIAVPPVDVSVPAITVPAVSMPAVNVSMPAITISPTRVKVPRILTPKVRVVTIGSGPI